MPKNPKGNDAETTAAKPALQPATQTTTADFGKQYVEAQQKFANVTNEASLKAHNTLLTAYSEYVTELGNAQREFEGYALEVYQSYLAKLSQISGGESSGGGRDRYWDFVRLTTELYSEGGWRASVEKAYAELLKAFAPTENPADAATRQTEAYRVYGEQLTQAWKEAEPTQKQAAEAYEAFVKDCQSGLAQDQTALESAYQDYLKDLNQAYIRSGCEKRAAAASKTYLAKALEACKQSQGAHTDAAKGLIDTQEKLVRSVQPQVV
jgi:hypothetical protein